MTTRGCVSACWQENAGKKSNWMDVCSISRIFWTPAPGSNSLPRSMRQRERRAVTRYLRRDLPVIELGGSMGVVACVTNKLLQNPRAHVVVEANPRAAAQLGHNRRLNGCEFEIVNCAIAYGTSSVNFRPSTNMAGSSITRPGDEMPVTVDAIQLGRIVEGRGLGPFSLICDIEGVEYDLVRQEIAVLAKAHTIIMETHARYIGEDKLRLMMAKLAEAGFKIIEEIGFVVVLQK